MQIILPLSKWNKAIDGLDVSDFSRWMLDYELSQLPSNTIFPRPGQVWETVRDCKVGFEACMEFSGPEFETLRLPNGETVTMLASGKRDVALPFGMARLRRGDRVRILARDDMVDFCGTQPICANLQPIRYDDLHESIVPQELRAASGNPAYKGYRLFVKTARPKWCLHPEAAYLNEDFKLIENVV